jgi:alginate O-acetyltransferase complex protein AlgI
MLFYTANFFVFFCVVFVVYWLLPWHRARMVWLLIGGACFYMAWPEQPPWFILLIVFSASVDYFVARWLERDLPSGMRRLLLVVSVGTNLGLLAYFKYSNFFLESAADALRILGFSGHAVTWASAVLPLGISFYTFETISYVVDVYRGRIRAVRNFVDYAVYIMFFPHLLAGPIVRPRDFLPQVRARKHFRWDRLQLGAQFFLLGLFKKCVLADQLASVADPVFADASVYGSSATWFAVVCYSLQIYCDFSGYSDMAIGLAHAFGFKLPFNFDMPYLSADITEFWRRWHISLSTWLRDYLYIPLGGNRYGALATYRNLMLTMLLGGLWHGASWTFVAWGLYHGLLLSLHRAVRLPACVGGRLPKPLAVVSTFLSVSVGWVFFRAQSFADAGTIMRRLAWPTNGQRLYLREIMLALGLMGVILAGHLLGRYVDVKRIERWATAPVLGTAMALALLLIQLLMPEGIKAFIYFQF